MRMPLAEEIKHLDEVVDDIMRSLADCTSVRLAVIASVLRVRGAGDEDVLANISDLISDPDYPPRQLADLASRLTLSKYRYQGDSLFSVLQVQGPGFQELVNAGDLGAATARFLEITRAQGRSPVNMNEKQAREIVAALFPGRLSRL